MIALTWQTLLILTVAYFAGCIVGCLARKLSGARPVATAEPAVQAAAPVPAQAPVPREVSRTAVAPVPAAEAAAPVERPAPDATPQPAFRRADHDTPEDVPPPEPAAPEPAPPARPAPIKAVEVPPPAAVAPPVSAAEAVAAAVAERMAVPTPPVAPEPVAPVAGDDFTRIRAIDAELAAKLNDLGVTRYAEIAAWRSDDVHTVSAALGLSGRIERENWIEQAQILARGGATAYATGLASGTLRAAAAEVVPSPPERGPDVAARAAFAEPRREALAPPPAPAKVSDRDNLQRIGGISAEIEDMLSAHDITRYSQIAGWSAADVQRVEGLLGFSGRISRENWIEQAQILARGGATAYSRAFDERGGPPAPMAVPPTSHALGPPPAAPLPQPAPSPAAEPALTESRAAERVADLSGMRSVRSEAFRAPDSMAAGPAAKVDDLKRIRGIGLLIERKLNAMGVSTYEQIANWTAEDVGTVNARLEFKGRIERENWIEQARILASGGQTDFSRRFERGET
ncbi:MAG: hypothetical protein ACK4TL_08395 [Hyphomicrobiaceae bacterium]